MNPTVDTHARHYPPGVTPDLVGGVPTMRDAWDRHVLERPQAPAVHYFDATLTFAEVDDAAAALASALAARGVVRGDRVAVYLQNDPQWLVTMLAAWKLGAVPVAVNPMLRAKELVHHLTDSSPVALVCLDSLYAEVVREVLGQTEVRVVVTTHPLDLTPGATLPDGVAVHVPPRRTFDDALDWHELLREHAGERPATVALSSEDIGVLTYTSGTTGRSKGAMNLHGAMVHSSTMYTAWWDLQPERDVVVGLAPVFHITGIIAGLGVHVLSGAPLVLMHRFDAGQTLRAIEQHRGTFMIAASTAFIALSNHPDLERHDVSSLTKTPSGGAPVSQALVDRVRERTGWVLRGAYGMTETSPVSCQTLADDDLERRTETIGRVHPHVEIKVVDPGTGETLPRGATGELCTRGYSVMLGYWDDPDRTAEAIDDEGWMHTGDLAVMREDGYCNIVGRIKDMVIRGGENIYPREIEEFLYTHPDVEDVQVVGVPDERYGEELCAWVRLREGAEPLDAAAVREFCHGRLAHYKVPRYVLVVEEFPMTVTGKIRKVEMREESARRLGLA